jgi:hypothetical protein
VSPSAATIRRTRPGLPRSHQVTAGSLDTASAGESGVSHEWPLPGAQVTRGGGYLWVWSRAVS